MVPWTPEYSVHIKEIDAQHNVIIAVTSELSEVVDKRADRKLIGTIIKKLSSFAQYHFSTEEKYFLLFNYEFAKEHIDQHDAMIKRLVEFERDYFELDKDITAELVSFTMYWLTTHILEHDKKYIDCFQKHGLH